MFSLKNYTTANTLDEAYDLLTSNKNNTILGGLMWMKLGTKQYHTGIDLSKLNLNYINETDETISIGGMTTLRTLETNEIIVKSIPNLTKAVKDIVGVQFRNTATLGGSVYSRFGFSDIITALLVHQTFVKLHHHGVVPLETFLNMKVSKDILIEIIVHKDTHQHTFLSERYNANDFSLVNVSLSRDNNQWLIAVGARPSRARLAIKAQEYLNKQSDNITDEVIKQVCEIMSEELTFGSNLKASAQYRQALAKVLLKRGIENLCK